jgi:dephospho-CoA kinase
MFVVGLTGGIASGKSSVSRVWRELGAHVLDADRISRELVEPGQPALTEIVEAFGSGMLRRDGTVDRKRLGAIVFGDDEARGRLNRILHPRIRQEMDRRLEAIGSADPEAIVVVDAALLVETGMHRSMDCVVVVACSETAQVERLRARDSLEPGEAARVIRAQGSLEEKLSVAHLVLRNEGTLEEMERGAKALFGRIREIAREKGKETA